MFDYKERLKKNVLRKTNFEEQKIDNALNSFDVELYKSDIIIEEWDETKKQPIDIPNDIFAYLKNTNKRIVSFYEKSHKYLVYKTIYELDKIQDLVEREVEVISFDERIHLTVFGYVYSKFIEHLKGTI